MIRIQADLHTHTAASTHAYSTILENCTSASELGLKAIAMTDHAMGMPDAPHLWHFLNMDVLPRKIRGVTVIRGIEADILEDGSLDIPDMLYDKLEFVIASLHSQAFRPAGIKEHTEAYLKVCENRSVDVIAHSTTAKFPYDMESCVKKFKEYEKLIEINESSLKSGKSRKETVVELLRICRKYDAPIVVNSDAHFCELVGKTDLALQLIEETGFPKRLVFNSDWDRIREHIINKHGDIGI